MSSIDHDHTHEAAESPAEHIAVEGSVGSDTDNGGSSKAEIATKDGPDAQQQHHARSNSVKKPATFKAVSVTKNFLAKAGTPPTPSTKTNGDNAAAPASSNAVVPPAPRPRLVAKTASGSQTSSAAKAVFGSKTGTAGPDPMQVWNRNRAAPQQPPKHFTDEELKQQYGIHLATRLQADGDGKEAKWADIDDDEDDWAPEAIEWNDGTKITLAANEAPATPVEEQKAGVAPTAEQIEEKKEVKEAEAPKPTTTVGPNATVLKPRSAAQNKPGVGVVLKNPSEKPSLVSKPAVSAPLRSPWAVLPPVDKVSPVAIKSSVEPSPLRPHSSDLDTQQSAAAPPTVPAMEIAADSFSRSRADGVNGHVGQLFNAQSGRYEPAHTGRRGSIRKDQTFRPPSVLQRGLSQDQKPTNEVHGAPGRNRNSGEPVTGAADGGPHGRRMSISKGLANGVHAERRESQHSQVLQSPTMGQAGAASIGSPTGSSAQPSIQSPASQHAQVVDLRSDTASPAQMRDDVGVQKLLMKEKREAAIKRRKEEEEREEAAKKERIRKKLESLGLPAEKEKPITASVPKPSELKDADSLQQQQTGPVPVPMERETAEPVLNSPQAAKATLEGQKSPPKPPAPDASGAPQQYGMIKMHGSSSNSAINPNGNRSPLKAKTLAASQDVKSPIQQPRTPGMANREPARLVNGATRLDSSPSKIIETAKADSVSRDTKPLWNDIPKDQKMLASAWSQQASARDASAGHGNVWGAPSQSRALGNGTFDRSSPRAQRNKEAFASPNLAPIGPPRVTHGMREFKDSNTDAALLLDDFQTLPTFPAADPPTNLGRYDPSKAASGIEERPMLAQYDHQATSRMPYANLDPKPQALDHQQSRVAAWGAFSMSVAQDEALRRQQQAAQIAEEVRTGARQEPQLPIMNETWKQVKVDDSSSQRTVVTVSRNQSAPGQAAGSRFGLDMKDAAFASQVTPVPTVAAASGRGSRFFPTAGRGGLLPYHPPMPFTPGFRRGSSPPPPDSDLHPAFARDNMRPRVSMPLVGPKPKVRLPPASTAAASPSQTIPSPEQHLRSVPSESWQAKFHGLLGTRKPSPEKVFSMPAVSTTADGGFSATKESFISPIAQTPAAVSLPPKSASPFTLAAFSADTKDAIEEEILFTPESGSLPVVILPAASARMPHVTSAALTRDTTKQSVSSEEVKPLSKETLLDPFLPGGGGAVIFIHLPGQKSIRKPFGQAHQQHARMAPAPNSRRQSNYGGYPKTNRADVRPRQTSGSFNPQQRHHAFPKGAPQTGPQHAPQAKNNMSGGPWKATPVH